MIIISSNYYPIKNKNSFNNQGETMGNMAEARRKMHERDERIKKENKSEVKKIRNFFFGCCDNKEKKKVKEH